MLIQGKKKYIKLKYYYSLSVIVVGVLMILLNGAKGNDQVIPLYMAVLGGVSSFVLIKSSAYALCREFYYLLKMPKLDSADDPSKGRT